MTGEKYVCTSCGYVYDPAEHDGAPFEALPDSALCPVCGVQKYRFIEEGSALEGEG